MTTITSARYFCGNERRREVVRASGALNGVDFIDVGAGQTILQVHFLQPLPGSGPGSVPLAPALTTGNVQVAGGARSVDVIVVSAMTTGDILTVTVDRPGAFSTYRLVIIDPATGNAPTGFDPRLAEVAFSFKAACPTDLDCDPPLLCPPEVRVEPIIDYLAKDYDSFRRLMLDRLATTLPDWTERNPADAQIAIVELLAYVADRLSYAQDAVATEAYLATARQRVSVRRHARLLDYRMHDGCSARAFLHFDVSTGLTLPAGTAVRTGDDPRAAIFETIHPVKARATHNRIELHTWSDEDCCLPKGSLQAALIDHNLALVPGDLLLFEEVIDPIEGGDPDPAHRQIVRLTQVQSGTDPLDGTAISEVAWDALDALTFALCVSSSRGRVGVARGNIALADHGETHHATLAAVAGKGAALTLPVEALAATCHYDPKAPASTLDLVDPHDAIPAVTLDDGDRVWLPAPDLLGAAAEAPFFVVETDDAGTPHVRFGDDESGQRPPDGTSFVATFRRGGGAAGNVAAEALTGLSSAIDGVSAVINPLAASGGVDAESSDVVRQLAPQRFRRQRRAVTEADYATLADHIPGIQRSAATMRWTGSWYTAFVTVDPVGGGAPDVALVEQTIETLDTLRMAGVDVEVSGPISVAVELALDICVEQGYSAAAVKAEVMQRLSAGPRADGGHGLFHPDNFTFGQAVYLSGVYQAVLGIAGVRSVQATTFRRFGSADAGELDAGILRVHRLEVAQLLNDPNFPERGRLTIATRGGR